VPLSNFVSRGFGFVHHSIAILHHEVPNPNLTIRNFFIAVWRRLPRTQMQAAGRVQIDRAILVEIFGEQPSGDEASGAASSSSSNTNGAR
jgi:hypothetical protein